jgi:uncharacterized membrane protein
MSKDRLEALSDNVFSIAMTLLVIGIAVPAFSHDPSVRELDVRLLALLPALGAFFASFTVLSMFWMAHNFFFSTITPRVNRELVLINMLYLAFISLVPFSAALLGKYADLWPAVVVYGLNIFAAGITASGLLYYAIISDEIDTSHIEPPRLRRARIRSLLTPLSALIGIGCASTSTPLALFFYAFPLAFNFLPSLFDVPGRAFGIRI